MLTLFANTVPFLTYFRQIPASLCRFRPFGEYPAHRARKTFFVFTGFPLDITAATPSLKIIPVGKTFIPYSWKTIISL
jgi:hypothetical protein